MLKYALSYRFPYLSKEEAEAGFRKLNYDVIKRYAKVKEKFFSGCGLLRYSHSNERWHYFDYYNFECLSEKGLLKEINKYALAHCIHYSSIPSLSGLMMAELKKASKEYADFNFNDDGTRVANEIINKLDSLRSWGISEAALRTLFEKPVVISRIVITRDFRIILPDYDDMEIKMTPLVKAVYILFLIHPEGLIFKELPNHRNELLEIYKALTNREDYDVIMQSVMDVTDPNSNSINEKCSRIKEAFLSKFCHSQSELYYVTSKRCDYNKPKMIAIDRAFVHFEDQNFLQGLQKYRPRVYQKYFCKPDLM